MCSRWSPYEIKRLDKISRRGHGYLLGNFLGIGFGRQQEQTVVTIRASGEDARFGIVIAATARQDGAAIFIGDVRYAVAAAGRDAIRTCRKTADAYEGEG
jgi:hypothetical protein